MCAGGEAPSGSAASLAGAKGVRAGSVYARWVGYWQRRSADFDERLTEVSRLFRDCREAFFETADRYHWEPFPGSGAERAAGDLPSPDPTIDQARGETGHRLITEVAQTFLLTAAGHLGGLASLYQSGEVLFSPPALIRATVENCAHALWVIGDNPEEPSEQRLARAYLEELISAEEAKMNAGRMRDKAHESHVRAATAYDALKMEILERFPDATAADLGSRTLLGQVLPKPEAAVIWMYDVTERMGGTISARVAKGIYGFLSNMTHPTLYPARQRRAWADDVREGHRVAYLRIDLGSQEQEARAALAAFYNALTYVTTYFDWPNDVLDELTDKIERTMPDFFR